jgi:hypothetical protein
MRALFVIVAALLSLWAAAPSAPLAGVGARPAMWVVDVDEAPRVEAAPSSGEPGQFAAVVESNSLTVETEEEEK